MTRRLLGILVLCALVAPAAGCLTVSTPAIGTFYADVKWDGGSTGMLGRKEGKACAESFLGLVATGDASIKAAAKAGGITNVTRVDHYTRHRLVMGEYCTIVGGN